jgi:hypothetical protein
MKRANILCAVSFGIALATACGGTSTTTPGGAANCPATVPDNAVACTAGQTGPCTYGSAVCECGGAAAAPTWTCTACPACPGTEPTGACTAGSAVCAALGSCSYGADECDCAAGMWRCGACPGTEPAAMAACTTEDLRCGYGATTCTCRAAAGGAAGAMMTDAWACVTPAPTCPATQPTAGGSCTAGTGGGAGCTYGANTCVCLAAGGDAGEEWSCN